MKELYINLLTGKIVEGTDDWLKRPQYRKVDHTTLLSSYLDDEWAKHYLWKKYKIRTYLNKDTKSWRVGHIDSGRSVHISIPEDLWKKYVTRQTLKKLAG